MRRRTAVTAVLLTSLAALLGGVAYAEGGGGPKAGGGHKQGSGSGGLGPGGVHVGLGVHWHPPTPAPSPTAPSTTIPAAGSRQGATTTTTPGDPGVTVPASTTTSDPDKWVTEPCPSCATSGMVCLANGQLGSVPPGTPLPPGDSVPWITYLTGPVGEASAEYTCPASATTTLPPPPQPTAEQVWESAPLPAPDIKVSPGTYGVAQLPTWFWLANDPVGQDLTLPTLSLGGYSVSLSVHPVSYNWSFGDGSGEVSLTAGNPGGAGRASASHTYTSKGTYQVGVSVAWEGTYTFAGYGLTRTVPLGPVMQTETTFPFAVQEVKSLLEQG